MTHMGFIYPVYTNQKTGRIFIYKLNESLCDDHLCNVIRLNGHINDAQLLMQEYISTDSVLVDVGSHMGEYMPMTLLQGAFYVSVEASPALVAFQKDTLHKNGQWVNNARIIHGYFANSERSFCIDRTNPGFYNFVVPDCYDPSLVIPRYDLSLLHELKREFPMKFLFVKFDCMINLCEFASSTYLGDYVDYEYVNWRVREQFGWGFPDCFSGALEQHYDVYVPTQGEAFNSRLLPVATIPLGPDSGDYTHVVLIKKRLRVDAAL